MRLLAAAVAAADARPVVRAADAVQRELGGR